ncbi:MAG TPA: hypothetical protein GX514_07230 [Thermoanaerobacterales bacterium]|uniref:hypothetical protein n=1 Tax=Tepidanaerobacter sp. GT38 TaxID=2722793 RepID=UPI0017EE73EB|nr:hypothetical protein [Tepidanaerobacter sp. GT38]MCG1013419.1 hypothetical protein [Tepidanaerobacter sp. GT38]HHY42622.1 hypothetical protein [Thermoanaerobacterales bacterium]
MRLIETVKGEIIKGDETYPYEVINDKVRIRLPFSIDFHKLYDLLKEQDYFVANSPELDSQGWGKDYDAEGYYPYWVYVENDDYYFAFPPEDYKLVHEPGAKPKHVPILGSKALEEFFRWLPLLKQARAVEGVLN